MAAKPTNRLNDPTRFMRVEEVMDLLMVSKSTAYRIMRQLNDELKKEGKIVTAGRVSRKYLMERTC